ncbi:hypothetical protein BC939DRAFT_335051 [Gamsiella multidivaricata]|uniref:uncharacterized protein n=1 Tax=Gamsiella multidivaricata TaxID=101098 RepID=UPI00221E4E4C|nr:uncharacterized protein BC939DRAFT_335051 [Gamsiella multidivaricata]KAI7817286.1 hypothetical protein BC939DRAFT_335051 [Gamsiella multidivaricata]
MKTQRPLLLQHKNLMMHISTVGDKFYFIVIKCGCWDHWNRKNHRKLTRIRHFYTAHHVIFVVHGMGRQLEEYGNYERNVGYLVENIKTVLQSVFHELETDVHIIPIEWHAKLHSLVDDRMALASLRTVPKVRMVMNDYLADILYYFNGHFGSVMIRMIVDDLNEAYETFMAKHPDFNGKISVFALSLGGVAMYDILTCLDDDDEDVESEKSRDDEGTAAKSKNATSDADQKVPGLKKNTEYGANTSGNKKPKVRKQDQTKFRAVVPKLKFRPHYLFTVGSPVGAVMVMRNLEWESFHPPDDIIHHNLYHPFDPLGYRIEPLIDSVFAGVPALAVTSYNTVSSQQLLFPSISLPSLPSLLPESISSFWENKVPALPRPSIPTLSSLSQMTQSLKAGGRWLSGNGVAAVVESTGGVATPVMTAGEEGDVSAQSETATSPVPSVGRQEEVEETHGHEVLSKVQEEEDALVDVKVSATECITPATATAYLGCSDTAEIAGSPNVKATTPVRRLSLGPRRVSSRIEDNQDAINAALLNQQQHQERDGACGSTSEALPEEAVDEMSSKKVSDDPSPMEIEYYLGMETGATAEEKAQGLGAKSDVVQESMVRRPSVSPHEIEAQVETASKDVSQPKLEDIQTEEEEEDPAATANKRRTAVHVEGRRTCVPYRIDYVLQETTVDQYTNEYLLGMRSHFRYWGNR